MRILLLFLMLGWSLQLSAQDSVSLSRYRNAVLGYSFQIKIADASESAAYELSRAAYKGFLPQLSASGDFSLNFREERAMKSGEMAKLQPYSFSLQPQIVQTIYGGGAVKNNYRQAEIRSQIAKLSSQYTVMEVVYAAEYAYWNLAANKEYLSAAQQYVNLISNLRVIIVERFNDGYISKSDLLMIDSRLEEAQYSLISARQGYQSALSNFNTLMGVDPAKDHALSDGVLKQTVSPQRIDLESTLMRRPDLEAKRKQVEQSEFGVKLARSPYNPQFAVGVSGIWKNDVPNFNGSNTVDGYAFARLSVPIFSWGERRRNVAAAKYSVDQSEFEVDLMTDNILNQESQAWIAITQSSQQVSSSVRSLNTGQENLDLSTFSYNEGQLSILDVMSAQASWLQLYMNAITAGYNHHVAISQYRLATGELP